MLLTPQKAAGIQNQRIDRLRAFAAGLGQRLRGYLTRQIPRDDFHQYGRHVRLVVKAWHPGDQITRCGIAVDPQPVAAAAREHVVISAPNALVGGKGVKPILGNFLNFAITSSLQEYDLSTDRWTVRASMPVGLHHVGIGVSSGKLYIIGGYKSAGLTVWHPVATGVLVLRAMSEGIAAPR